LWNEAPSTDDAHQRYDAPDAQHNCVIQMCLALYLALCRNI